MLELNATGGVSSMRTSVLFVTTALACACAFSINIPVRADSVDDALDHMLPAVSASIQERAMSGYVYQPTGTVVSRSATSELNASVTVGKVSSELYLIDTKGYNEQEVNFYYADSFKKTPFGKVDFSLMTGAWREPDGWIVPVTGEVSHDIVLHKSTTTNGITLTPFTGFSQWFGFGKEMNLAYVQSGLRSLLQLTPRISFSTEAAYSQCVHEAGTVSLRASTQALPSFSECHSVPYGNLSLICDIGNRFKLILGGQFTKDAPATAGLALVKRF